MADAATIREFAPTGRLRVALNHGNRVLVGRDGDGRPVGISVDLARALADHLGLALDFVEYERAVDVSASALDGVWDVCFLAVDPERAETIAFTAPYVGIEGSYLAGTGCAASDAGALVASGAPVGTVRGSAYTLTLQRLPGAGHLVMFETVEDALAALDAGRVAAIAGIRPAMEARAASRPGTRILQPPFMQIRQAMAVPQGRPAALAELSDFLAALLLDGRLGDMLDAHGAGRASAIMPATGGSAAI